MEFRKKKFLFSVFPVLCLLLTAHCSLFTVSCITLSHVEGSAESPDAVSPRWTPLQVSGLEYYAGKVSHPHIEFHALRVDLRSPNLRIMASPGGTDSEGKTVSTKVSSFVRDNGLVAGINALPFDPVSGTEGEPRLNIGIVISDRVVFSPPHKGFDALLIFIDRRAAIEAQAEIIEFDNIEAAVGGFNRILEHGELVPRVLSLTDRHPRSAAGISPDNNYLYLLVIDGRQLKSIGSTEAETALLLKALGAAEGINFDGGGSSSLVLRRPNGKIRVMNTPIHGMVPGRERGVAGCLGIESK